MVRGGGPTSGHHRGGVGELADIGQAWRGPRWCLMGVVRVLVTAPAKFDSGRRGHHWPGLHRQLVLASARQSAAVDLRRLPDEFVGLPTGFLVSGVATFVGTLWPTGDVPTALMTMRIIELMFPRDPSAKALSRPGRSGRRGPGCVTSPALNSRRSRRANPAPQEVGGPSRPSRHATLPASATRLRWSRPPRADRHGRFTR